MVPDPVAVAPAQPAQPTRTASRWPRWPAARSPCDSKDPHGPVFLFPTDAWTTFLTTVSSR
ncbi:DUF397 domain-containing protein [Solwaraspora sp. WMMB335]|uniref:DUF397 domain-containing protein n=1 Tax=Solwaraspora sp. WMMB335 TaxID=3404118 RepID=UPI003B93B5D0